MKTLTFMGTSLADLRQFPEDARITAGRQLNKVQQGAEPDDWKPMASIGPGVRELRVRDAAGAFRVIYTATRLGRVYVLHAFEKRTERTTLRDIRLAKARLRDIRGEGP